MTPTNDIVITLPRPHPAQQRIINEARRFNVVDCGRRFGKTTLGIDRAVDPEVVPYPVGWFSPSYKMMLEVWREASLALKPIVKRRNVQERRIENIAGGVLEFWSLDNPDVARGRKYRRVIIDEAAMVPNLMDTWQHVIRPALADYAGDAWVLSTPKGHNGFWQMYQWGEDKAINNWTCWQMPTSANPYIADEEIEAMYQTMPERVYQQEIMAEFLDSSGGVFRHIVEAVEDTLQDELIPDRRQYVMGVDWGKVNDFTVLTVIDVSLGHVVAIDRFKDIDYRIQRERLKALYERFKPFTVIIEDNIESANIEELVRDNIPVQPFRTSNPSKVQIVEDLAVAFEFGRIKIPDDPILIGELLAFEIGKSPSGKVTYSAPDGMHDDMVISLALAWHGAKRPSAPLVVPDAGTSRWSAVAPATNGGGRWKKF